MGKNNTKRYGKGLNYALKNSEERIEALNNIIDENLIEQFEKEKYSILSKKDKLHSNQGLAIDLEKLASYILSSADAKEETKIKSYNTKELNDRGHKEQRLIYDIASISSEAGKMPYSDEEKKAEDTNIIEHIDLFEITKGNYTRRKRSKFKDITKDDYDKHEVLGEYKQSYDHLHDKLKDLRSKKGLTTEEIRDKKTIQKNMGLVKRDILDVKECIERPIKFKNAITSNTVVDYDKFDFSNKEQVKALLRIDIDKVKVKDGLLRDTILDLECYISETQFTDRQFEILKLYRSDKDEYEIAEELDIDRAAVNRHIDSIIERISGAYNERLEDWYYLNIEKGEYKKCKKCDEILLKSKFNKNARRKDGYETFCKKCK